MVMKRALSTKPSFHEEVTYRLNRQSAETGPLSIEMGAMYAALGNQAFEKGFKHQAIRLHTSGVEILSLKAPTDSELLANCLLSLGNDYTANGQAEKALHYHARAYSIYTTRFLPTHPAVANLINSLATDYSALEKWQLAVPLQRQAVRIFKACSDPRLSEALNNLGNIYFHIKEYPLACNYLRKAEKTLLFQHKKDSLAMGNVLTNLGNAYFAMGKFKLALKLHMKGRKLKARNLVATHPDLANSMNSLGNDYLALGKPEIAVKWLEKAVRLIGFQKNCQMARVIERNYGVALAAAQQNT